ncbi:hypothetical protein ABZX85_12815 [Streptomyces sp. NPDC004539]
MPTPSPAPVPVPPPPDPELPTTHEMFMAVMTAPHLNRPRPAPGRRW